MKGTYFLLLVLCLLALDYYFMYVDTPRPLISFIQTVTYNTPRPIQAGTKEARMYLEAMRQRGELPAGRRGRKGANRTAEDELSDESIFEGETPVYAPYAFARFSTKLHLTNQLQLLIEYPLSYFCSVHLHLADVPFISANVISLLHPLFGMLAGYYIYQATGSKGEQRSAIDPSTSPGHGSQPMSPGMGAPVDHDETDELIVGSPGLGKHQRTNSFPAIAIPPESPLAPATPCAESADAALKKSYAGRVVKVDVKMVRLGCFFFVVRNFLDTLDGVIARVQRRKTGANASPTTYGFNGHTLDVTTDLLGVGLALLGVVMYLWARNMALSQFWAAALHRLGVRVHITRPQHFVKLVSVAGLVLLFATVGYNWEKVLMRHVNIFDEYAPWNPEIYELEKSAHLRFHQLCWSWTCGDSLIVITIFALWFDKLWALTQALFFLGFLWVLFMCTWAAYVWYYIVLANPTAAAIVAANPGAFH